MRDLVLNRDWCRRESLLGISVDWERDPSGTASFQNCNLTALEALFSLGFVNPDDRQNASPSAKDFLDFMRQFPRALAHGYVTSPTRDDYRVTIEGMHVPRKYATKRLRKRFRGFCSGADILKPCMHLYSWWD